MDQYENWIFPEKSEEDWDWEWELEKYAVIMAAIAEEEGDRNQRLSQEQIDNLIPHITMGKVAYYIKTLLRVR